MSKFQCTAPIWGMGSLNIIIIVSTDSNVITVLSTPINLFNKFSFMNILLPLYLFSTIDSK